MDEYEGEYPFATPPGCPPPVVRDLGEGEWSLTSNRDRQTFMLDVPDYTLGVGGWVNTTGPGQNGRWQGGDLTVSIVTPDDNRTWSDLREGNASGAPGLPFLTGQQSNDRAEFQFRSDEEWGTEEAPPWGRYRLIIEAENAVDIEGTFLFRVVVACGGMAS